LSTFLQTVDYDFWNPEIDTYIASNYTSKNWQEGKSKNKQALRDRLLLQTADKPIIAYIGRLDDQKGVHLVHHAIYYSLHNSAQFVLLGSATESGINARFWQEKSFLNDNPDCHLELSFNEELSHLIYAGADIIIVPSNYEPCGLTQLIALKYGTVPVVRGVGGLVNTVFDRDYNNDVPPEKRNGYMFYQTDDYAMESSLERALKLWYNSAKDFQQLALQGMEYDYSWNNPGQEYVDVYEYILCK
jgi:starch synthase